MLTTIHSTNLNDEYQLLRVLGRGGEGIVYLAQENSTGEKLVLKIRFEPIQGTATAGLKSYASNVTSNPYGLPTIKLFGEDDEIQAVGYPFLPLYPISWRILNHSETVAQALFGAYCRMQGYLLDCCKIGLLDTVKENYMISQDGRFYCIDFGFGIRSAQHPQVLDKGRLGYGFVMMLFSIYNMNIKSRITPITGYSLDEPCVYSRSKSVDPLMESHPWIRNIISEVRAQKAAIFHTSEFYWQLAERLPQYLPFGQLVGMSSRLLHYSSAIRQRI